MNTGKLSLLGTLVLILISYGTSEAQTIVVREKLPNGDLILEIDGQLARTITVPTADRIDQERLELDFLRGQNATLKADNQNLLDQVFNLTQQVDLAKLLVRQVNERSTALQDKHVAQLNLKDAEIKMLTIELRECEHLKTKGRLSKILDSVPVRVFAIVAPAAIAVLR